MRAIMVMFDSLNRHMLPQYRNIKTELELPNFERLTEKTAVFNNFYIGSMPCMPARRELHTGRLNFLHRSWGPLEPFDDSMPQLLSQNGVYTHLISDHIHYWEDGGATYHQRYDSWEIVRGQENDKWIGLVNKPDSRKKIGMEISTQESTRTVVKNEEDFPITKTFDHAIEFLNRNEGADNWFLQVETFDPHEPFYTPENYRQNFDLKNDDDWPYYIHSDEIPLEERDWYEKDIVRHYQALLTMCDKNLGKILDIMDEKNMWEDTMLIVNTDHGFFLGEHQAYGKCFFPFYQQVANIPFYLWNPVTGQKNVVIDSLSQTIDIAPTLLEYFNVKIPENMSGKSLSIGTSESSPFREGILYGMHGAHINITDGRYVYMKAPKKGEEFYEYTLMPMHMSHLFEVGEFQNAELVEPLSFTKGYPVLKLKGTPRWFEEEENELYCMKDELYDLERDPEQKNNLIDDKELVLHMEKKMIELMHEHDAPEELYKRYGLKI